MSIVELGSPAHELKRALLLCSLQCVRSSDACRALFHEDYKRVLIGSVKHSASVSPREAKQPCVLSTYVYFQTDTRGTAGAGQVAADVSQAAVVSSPAPRSGTAEDARPALRAPRPHGHRSSESPAWSCPCRCASSCDARPASGAHYARVDKALYQGNQFKCRDGSFVISIKQVNDDYCDCPDGSDEPGAPRSVVFWCASLDSQTPKVPLRARTARSGARTRV